MLDATGIVAGYPGHRVLDGVDLRTPEGCVTGVLGPNGAGKSTLLRVIAGLLPVEAGMVTLDGEPLAVHRADVAYLPQRAALDWDFPLQVRDVVALGRYPRRRLRRRTAADRAVVADALTRLELESVARRPIRALSGGQRQRALLARALAQDASVLLLDEPFDGVDARTAAILDRELADAAAGGRSVIVVDHDLDAARTRFGHVVLLAGHVVAAGPPAQALTPVSLRTAYQGHVIVDGVA